MIEIGISVTGTPTLFDRWFLTAPAQGDIIYIDGKNYEVKLVCHFPQIGQSPAMPAIRLQVSEV